jgi:hypothetical protein
VPEFKIDPKLAESISAMFGDFIKGIATAAADAALAEVRQKLRDGADEVDGRLGQVQRKVRSRRKTPVETDSGVVDAEWEEAPSRGRRR